MDNNNIITFLSIFRNLVIRNQIFKEILEFKTTSTSKPPLRYIRGESLIDHIRGGDLLVIGIFSLDWSFIKHYLPLVQDVSLDIQCKAISQYCMRLHANHNTVEQLLKWSRDYQPVSLSSPNNTIMLDYIIGKTGNLDIAQLLLERFPNLKISYKAFDWASSNGHLENLIWLTNNQRIGCTVSAMDDAAKNGHLNIVHYLDKTRVEGCTTNAIDNASLNGHLNIVKYLIENRIEGCTIEAMNNCAKNDHFMIFKYLHEKGFNCNEKAMNYCCLNGNLEFLKFIHLNRTEGCSFLAMDNASKNGHLDILKYLKLNRTEGCKDAMEYAMSNGYLDIVVWLHQNMNQEPMTVYVVAPARNGHLDIVEWIFKHYPDRIGSVVMDAAASRGQLHIVQWLHQNNGTVGCSKNAMDMAIQWLHQYRSEGCTSQAVINAIFGQHLDTIIWLFENRTECDPEQAYKTAINMNFQSIKY
ncbi:hypothetical protein DFA_06282 [Cavenderia fasciculata]|uniref:Ankyrin repeat-containing protein n=1 Tax=Cavenderia fasciculata TaxID=261658 RepID=F4PKL5_CACFS|nr:uncharacterized protein DFA_06282 [Cavenderia fasciculata]EGG24139.1 hypothetical protein DFA_06282 [Cavenderia fasciculata]|eukprot:XP_004361990.1 hypothetical protein DFA_06282 [Cavenderia fasciculata]